MKNYLIDGDVRCKDIGFTFIKIIRNILMKNYLIVVPVRCKD